MRRITWMTAAVICVICVTALIAGCGKKEAKDVVKDLDHMITKLESYKGEGTMVLHTGQKPQEYQVEVWYRNPHYYRISLTNQGKDITQIVLRNDDGVFVLTPHLNKSFRFQSDWPNNQGQVYLYQTLVNSILSDNNRQFADDNKTYVFDVLADYQTNSLARQKIWLDKGDYAPRRVEITDANAKVMVEVNFTKFEFNKDFEKDSFDMQRNMTTGSLLHVPVMAGGDDEDLVENDEETATDDTASETPSATPTAAKEPEFGIIMPLYDPDGVALKDMDEIMLGEGKAIRLHYAGDYNYTLIESRAADRAVSAVKSKAVDLGYTTGFLSGDEFKTMTWTTEGVEYRLSSGDLPLSEMIHIAQSVQGQIGK